MGNRLIIILALIAAVVVVFAVITFNRTQMLYSRQAAVQQSETATPVSNPHNMSGTPADAAKAGKHDYARGIVKPRQGQPIKQFKMTALETNIRLKDGMSMAAWTFNGNVPGPEIRVKQGDFVQVELKNNLREPVTIHWHGYPLKSAMDGVPGLNQDAVGPGETFVYEFSADVPGTYWYHSHQESAKQVDKGLYGALIVEPADQGRIDRDYSLILDEWMSNPEAGVGGDSETGGHNGTDMSASTDSSHSVMTMPAAGGDQVMEEEQMMAYMYDIYTVNGKSAELITPLEAKVGEVVHLRFINAGYRTHGIHIPGQDIKVVSTDGQDINDATLIKDQIIMIAPGERYDVEFTVASGDSFVIDAHDDNAYNDQLKIPFNVTDGTGNRVSEPLIAEFPVFNLFNYGSPGTGKFSLEQSYSVDQRVELGTDTADNTLKYTINGKVFKELPPLQVKTGDVVKLTYINNSQVDHPMHLHGHFFQVLSRNGMPLTGAAIIKDTLLIKPGEAYEVAFNADNTGNWVQHCHELHHASAGMMQAVIYTDFESVYKPDPNNPVNKPE